MIIMNCRIVILFFVFLLGTQYLYSQKVLWETGVTGEYGITSPKGDIVATVGSRIISIWDWKQQLCLRNIRVHTNRVMQLSFTPNGETLASVSRDTTIAFHSMKEFSVERIKVPSESWLESGSFTPSGKHFVVVNRDLDVFVYETESKKLIHSKRKFLQNDGQPISFASDGNTIITSTDFALVERVNLLTEKREIIKTVPTQEMITSIQISPDNAAFVVVTTDGKAMMYSNSNGSDPNRVGSAKDTIVAFRWGKNSKEYSWVTTNGFVIVAENSTRKFVRYVEDFTLENFMVSTQQDIVTAVESDGTVRLFSTSNGKMLGKISHIVQGSYSIAFLDEERALSIQLDGTIQVNARNDGSTIQTVKKNEGGWFTLSKDKKKFVQFGVSDLTIYDSKNIDIIATINFSVDNITGAVWAEKNSKLYVSGSDGFIRILTTSPLKCIDSFRVSDKALSSCSLSENEQLLSVVCDDLTTKIIQIKSQTVIDSYSKNNGRQVSAFFSENDTYLYSSSVTGFVWKWDLKMADAVNVFPEPNVSLTTIQLSPSNATLITTTLNGNIRFWDSKTYQVYHTIDNPSIVTSLTVSEDGKRMLTAYADGTIRLWNVEDILK
jgi:WD40 repeat protein